MSSRASTSSTVNLFLSGMSLVYLWAFLSLYPQIPGLYGPTGILPIHRLHSSQYSKPCTSMSWNDIKQNPSLFCLVNDLEISPIYIMELLCIIGIITSFFCFLSHFIRHNLTFFSFSLLWLCYLSLYSVGQTFMSFQWDILLLEAGFLCIFVSSSKDISFFLIRWLLFRLMFASFMVKLQSQCPTWWSLSALDWHFESQCIPTSASSFFHFLPKWFNHISVIAVFVIEGPLSILYILPTHFGANHILKQSRNIAAYANILLMCVIAISGNYNFFNALTIVLTFACFDDEHSKKANKYVIAIEFTLWIALFLCVFYYFDVDQINFSLNDLNQSGSIFIMIAVCFGFVNIACFIIYAIVNLQFMSFGKIFVGFYIFQISLIPFLSGIDYDSKYQYTQKYILSNSYFNFIRNDLFLPMYNFHLVSGYGLFRRMTGVGGRPEIQIFVRFDDVDLDKEFDGNSMYKWHSIPFLYKPNFDLDESPKFIAPHQPRLDWQFWFAALGNYQNNPWFLSFLYRLAAPEKGSAIYDLIDYEKYEKSKNVKHLVANLYTYHYTNVSAEECDVEQGKSLRGMWWTREYERDYFPMMSVEQLNGLKGWMKKNGFLERPIFDGESQQNKIAKSIRFIRWMYRIAYHQKYDIVAIIHGVTVALFALRFVHERVQGGSYVDVLK